MPAERVCTLYVGKIPPSVEDETLTELLGCCGSIVKWKRTVDLDSGKPKPFGFCDFATGEGVLRALRLLKTIRLAGAELLLKVDQKTQDFLRDYEFARNSVLAARKEAAAQAPAAGGDTSETLIGNDEEADPAASLRIAEIVSKWEASQAPEVSQASKNASLADQLLCSLTQPPAQASSDAAQPNNAHSKNEGADAAALGRVGRDADPGQRQTLREMEEDRSRSRDRDRQNKEEESEQDEESRKRDRDMKFRERERAWERREEELRRARERADRGDKDDSRRGDRRGDRRDDRGRDRDGYRDSRSRDDRYREDRGRDVSVRDRTEILRRVRKEREEDELDRKKEAIELEQEERKRLEEERARREAEARVLAEAQAAVAAKEAAEAREAAARAEAEAVSKAAKLAEEIRLAAEAKAAEEAREREAAVARALAASGGASGGVDPPKSLVPAPGLGRGRGLSLSGGRGRGRATLAKPATGFGEEETQARRPLIPIDYGDDESAMPGPPSTSSSTAMPAAPPPTGAGAAPLGSCAAASAFAATSGPSAEELKAMIATIPAQRDELFAAPVEWDVAGAADIAEKKIRPWVGKKMVEFLGEDEPTLVNYVIGKMQARASPQEIEEELSKVLDDEAGPFMLKLWRMLLFEILRAKAIAERAAATFIPRA